MNNSFLQETDIEKPGKVQLWFAQTDAQQKSVDFGFEETQIGYEFIDAVKDDVDFLNTILRENQYVPNEEWFQKMQKNFQDLLINCQLEDRKKLGTIIGFTMVGLGGVILLGVSVIGLIVAAAGGLVGGMMGGYLGQKIKRKITKKQSLNHFDLYVLKIHCIHQIVIESDKKNKFCINTHRFYFEKLIEELIPAIYYKNYDKSFFKGFQAVFDEIIIEISQQINQRAVYLTYKLTKLLLYKVSLKQKQGETARKSHITQQHCLNIAHVVNSVLQPYLMILQMNQNQLKQLKDIQFKIQKFISSIEVIQILEKYQEDKVDQEKVQQFYGKLQNKVVLDDLQAYFDKEFLEEAIKARQREGLENEKDPQKDGGEIKQSNILDMIIGMNSQHQKNKSPEQPSQENKSFKIVQKNRGSVQQGKKLEQEFQKNSSSDSDDDEQQEDLENGNFQNIKGPKLEKFDNQMDPKFLESGGTGTFLNSGIIKDSNQMRPEKNNSDIMMKSSVRSFDRQQIKEGQFLQMNSFEDQQSRYDEDEIQSPSIKRSKDDHIINQDNIEINMSPDFMRNSMKKSQQEQRKSEGNQNSEADKNAISQEEAEKLRDLEEKLQSMLSLITENCVEKKWENVIQKEKLEIYQQITPGNPSVLVRCDSIVQGCGVDEVFFQIYNAELRKHWDQVTLGLQVIQKYDEFTDVIYFYVDAGFGVDQRDFLQRRIYKKDYPKQGEYVIMYYSITHPACPPKGKGWTRAHTYIAGYYIRTCPTDPQSCSLSIITQCDIKGLVPQFVVNSIAARAPGDWVQTMKKGCEDYRLKANGGPPANVSQKQ